MLRITFESAIITSVFFRKRQKSMYLSTQNLEMIERLSAEPVQQKQGLREYVFRHIVPSPQRIIKHIPMCKAGKQSLLLYIYYNIYIIIKFYCHFILYWKHLNDTLWRCGVVAQGRINVSFLSPLHSSSSSIPYWPQIHFTATGGRSCVLGVMPHWLNCSLCCFIQRWKVL